MARVGKNTPIGLWLDRAFQDYAGSRCLILNHLPAGFVLAQQAVEKLLKAYLRTSHPSVWKFVGKGGLTDPLLHVTPSHDLLAHATLVETHFPRVQILSKYSWLLRELSLSFERKYPDNQAPSGSSTTEWLRSIDELVVDLALKVPADSKTLWRIGVFHSAWPLVLSGQADPPWSIWVRKDNEAFEKAMPHIRQVIVAGHEAEYPGQQI
jgi:hypothetical protein